MGGRSQGGDINIDYNGLIVMLEIIDSESA